jgi:hypothetical protein
MMYRLFQVAVMELGEKEKDVPKIVLNPITVVAKDDRDAALKVAMTSDELKGKDASRLEVVVRPF